MMYNVMRVVWVLTVLLGTWSSSAFSEAGGGAAPAAGAVVGKQSVSSAAPPASTFGPLAPVGASAAQTSSQGSLTGSTGRQEGAGNLLAPNQTTGGTQQSADGTASTGAESTAQQSGPATAAADGAGEASALERAMQDHADGSQKAKPQASRIAPLQQFGYTFFRAGAREFAPLTDIPVGTDYILGSGDRIHLTIWGSLETSLELEINQNGDVVIPKVGTVRLAGVSYGQLPTLLKAQLGQYLKDFQISVTMGRLRLVKVYVVGQVRSPGDYTISGLSTVLNALSAAGGPTKNGTLRSVVVKRNGVVVETVDLYDFFLKGNKSKDIRLQPGDTIYVPSIGPVAGIGGNVRRPAIYELKHEKNLKDLLALADGLIPTGYLQRVQISRVDAHDKVTVSDINLDPKASGKALDAITQSVMIKDLDQVKVFPIDGTLRGYTRLEGYVLRPGDYALQPGMRVADLLGQDNLLPEYYGEAGQLLRLVAPDFHPEVKYFNVKQAMANDPAQNIELQEFDTIRIFSRWEMEEMPQVRVSGEVQKPGTYRLFNGMRVRDLLVFAGNLKLTAFIRNAEITRTDYSGTAVKSYPLQIDLGKALAGDPQHNIVLEKFDELYIRKIPNWSEETERYVTLQGEFLFPGTYPVYRGERLSSVIKRAGGFTERAYLRAARLTRPSVQRQQQQRMDEALQRAEKDLAQKQASVSATSLSKEELESTKATLEGLTRSLEKLRGMRAEGRVVIKLTPLPLFEQSSFDLVLEGGEVLAVPQEPGVVHILGNVYNQTSFVYQPDDSDLDVYLEKAGGPTSEADSSEMYVIKADGSVVSKKQFPLFSFNRFSGTALLPGDTLVVPQKIERTAWLRDLKDITQILANVALSAGSVYLWFK